MSGARIGALALRIARGFRRDPRSLALIVVVPLIVMALIGYMVSGNREPLKVGVVEVVPDPGGADAPVVAFQEVLRTQPGLEVVTVPDEATGRAQVEDGTLSGLVLAEGVGVGPAATLGPVLVVVRGTDVQVEAPITFAAASAAAATRGQPVPPGDLPGITVERIDLPTNERPSTISYAAPAMITVFAFLFTFMLTSVSFLRERSSGTLERLLASPVTESEILVGYLLGFLGFAMIQGLLVLGYATLVLHAEIAGPTWIVFTVLTLLVVGVVNLGIALSFFARNELQVIQFIPLVLLPQVFLGGLFWPVQTLWPPLQWLSRLFPVTYAVAALRAVMIGGSGLDEVAGWLLALVAFALAMIALGIVVLRRSRA